MAAMPLRQQVIDYVDRLDDERAEMVLVFLQTLANADGELQNSKTPAERIQAAKALAELETMKFTTKTNRGNFSEDDLSGLIHNNGACVAVFSG